MSKYAFYTYFRSSCSARVRIAAHLKGIDLEYHFIHLLKNEQQTSQYKDLNPSGAVPTLIVTDENGRKFILRQSIAILEYLEESRPDLQVLLPPASDPIDRARVRELVNVVACDIQGATSSRALNRAEALGSSKGDWAREFMTKGLAAYEALVQDSAGQYSVGDKVTLADVCLSPAVDQALRFEVDIYSFPTVSRLYESLQKLDAFQKGGWRAQPDTPDEYRQ